MKNKRNIISWLLPLFWGIMMFNILRAITDLTRRDAFWHGDMTLHIISVICSVLFCYIMDFYWRYKLNKTTPNTSVTKEYVGVLLELFILFNIVLYIGRVFHIFFYDTLADYILIITSYIPCLLLYYTLIRNDTVSRNYQQKILQLEKLKTEKFETELKYLKSQYHPHFLFNALNTIYFQVDEKNETAKYSLELLANLLRYQLYDIQKEVIISQEIEFLKSYIAFQQLRKSERLLLDVYFDPDLKEQKIHPLLFQPFIENAFKYVGGDYRITLELKLNDGQIHFHIENSIPENRSSDSGKNKGIGIENIQRKLEILYPDQHSLKIENTENLFTVDLILDSRSSP